MHFDAKRLSILAGISPGNAMLNEGADTTEKKGSWKKGEKSKTHPGEEDDTWEAGEKSKTDKGTHDRGERSGDESGKELDEADEAVYDIDEGMLRRELQNIRRERQQALGEAKVRNVIRHEINHIFQELSHSDLNLGASWVYGKNTPTSSKAGQLWVGGPSIGFKK